MPTRSLPPLPRFAVIAALVTIPFLASAQQEGTVHSFGNGTDGYHPYSGLISDSSGNLYGTTVRGGIYHLGYFQGIAFQLVPQTNGTWKENVLHNFAGPGDGFGPNGNLAFDAAGNLYGVTNAGGTGGGCYQGCGTVFALRPPAKQGGAWTEAVIFDFQSIGVNPQSGLVIDSAGNLYGVGSEVGIKFDYNSVVYELTPHGETWTQTVLYAFNAKGTDGLNPNGPLIFDSAGNLYGTTAAGGAYGHGTVFELSPQATGQWQLKTLHSFQPGSGDGSGPVASVIFEGGNLYGTTSAGGAANRGTVFELSPSSNGNWTENILYNFSANNQTTDGSSPGAILFDKAGNIYGVTQAGGAYGYGYGTVFELAPGNGAWTEQVLHSFNLTTDGSSPWLGMVLSSEGNLYGTCVYGGKYYDQFATDDAGTVFEIKLK